MIVHLGTDLMMASAIGATARRLELPFRSVTDVGRLMELLSSGTVCRLLLVDLQLPRIDVPSLAGQLKGLAEAAPEVVWFAQHVHEGLLQAASDCGVGKVMTRGQLHSRLDGLLEGVRDAGISG